MADAFMSALFGANTVKAIARFKDTATGKNKTVSLLSIPTDLTDDAFMEAAKDGVDLSAKSIGSNPDRTKNISGKGVYGAAASSATANVLGVTPPTKPEKKPEKKPETIGADGFAK